MLITALLLTCLELPGAAPPTGGEVNAPNVVMIVIDDLGWRDLGCYGADFYETPRIDGLATQGMRFSAGYSNGPNCAPSRACLMTGRATPRHGIFTVNSAARGKRKTRKLLVPKNRKALRDEEWTLAEALKTRGYECATIGKWHLGDDPLAQGFDVNVAGDQRGHPKSYFSPYSNPQLEDGEEGEHLTARLTEEAIAFLEAQREGPFLLYLPYFAVHTPIQPRADLLAKYIEKKRAAGIDSKLPRPAYAAMVEAVDEGVGRVLDALERLELSDSTLVVLVSDNGGLAQQTSMAPLRGSKGMLYEGGVRVPMMARWPGVIEADSQCATPVIGSDWFTTIVDACDVQLPAKLETDGVSLLPVMRGEEALAERALHWHFPAYLEGSSRTSDLWRTTPVGAIREGRYKLLEFFEDSRVELYDLEADLGEAKNLAEELPEVRSRLLDELRAWRGFVGAEVPSDLNPAYESGQ